MTDAIPLGGESQSQTPPDSLSGTKLHNALGQAAGAAVATVASGGAMGLIGLASRVGNMTAVAIIGACFAAAFFWLRADAMTERADYRAQVLRAEQQNEDRRKEDRADRQRLEDLFSRTLETMTRDNRDSTNQMKIVSEQMKTAAEQMRMSADTIARIEKLLAAKAPAGG